WIDVGSAPLQSHVSYCGTGAGTAVHRLRLGEVVAPAFVVARSADGVAELDAHVREAGWPVPGDTVMSRKRTEPATTNPSSTTAPVTPRAQRSEGRQSLQHDARALHRLRVPAGSARVVALADSFWIAPAPLQVERRGEWHVRAPASLEAGMATP